MNKFWGMIQDGRVAKRCATPVTTLKLQLNYETVNLEKQLKYS